MKTRVAIVEWSRTLAINVLFPFEVFGALPREIEMAWKMEMARGGDGDSRKKMEIER